MIQVTVIVQIITCLVMLSVMMDSTDGYKKEKEMEWEMVPMHKEPVCHCPEPKIIIEKVPYPVIEKIKIPVHHHHVIIKKKEKKEKPPKKPKPKKKKKKKKDKKYKKMYKVWISLSVCRIPC